MKMISVIIDSTEKYTSSISLFFLLILILLSGIGATLPIPNLLKIEDEFSFPSGLIEACFVIVTMLFLIIWGFFVDIFSRKAILVFANIVWVISSFLIFLFGDSLTIYFPLRMLMGMGLSSLFPLAYSLIADFARYQYRGTVSSGLNLAWVGASALGIIIGGQFQRWQDSFGFIAIIGIILIIISSRLSIPKRAQTEPAFEKLDNYTYEWRLNYSQIKNAAKTRSLWFLLLQGTFALIPGTVYSYWLVSYLASTDQGYGIQLALASVLAVVIGSGRALGYIIFGSVGDKLSSTKNRKYTVVLASICMFGQAPFFFLAFLINYSETHSLLLFAIFFWIASFIGGASGPNRTALLFATTLPETRGTLGSLFSITDHIGEALGLFISTFLFITFSFKETFLVVTLIYAIAAVIWLGTVFYINPDSDEVQRILWDRTKKIQE